MRSFRLALALCVGLIVSGVAQAEKVNPIHPFPPHKVIGNIYFVGSADYASYLLPTSQGSILLNSGPTYEVPLVKKNIESLGFKFNDIKIILISHAHWDHCAGSALIKQMTGAKYMVMDGDIPVIESGGKTDFNYGEDPTKLFEVTKVDRVLHDGDTVKLGELTLTAHLTPGHTKGCTTWTWKTTEGGKSYNVVVVGSPNVNPGYKIWKNAKYPQIAQDYVKSFKVWKSLPCDIFLGAHGNYYGMAEKYPKLKAGGANPFIDPAGYKKYIADKEVEFQKELAKQKGS